MSRTDFINAIAPIVQMYAPQYDILCPSAVIAQAILESGWGESRLSKDYHNYFGLKCGTLWKGKAVNMATQEEFEPGVVTDITDDFRVYGSMDEGVKGYFEFIQLPRYANLKGISYYRTYLQTIKADGYATSSTYVESACKIVEENNLERYDTMSNRITAQQIIDIMRGWIGLSRSAGTHKQIIDTYNSYLPRARNYAVQYTDAYCDTTVSAAFIKAGNPDIIGGTECGVEEHVKKFQAAGIWIEDGTITPAPGDIIVFNWDDDTQPNNGFSDHIGIVESVSENMITTIEGNINGGMVGRRNIPVGWGYIRGYARPRYQTETGAEEVPFVKEYHPVKTTSGNLTVPYIKFGTTGAMVILVQTALNLVAGTSLKIDGEFGAATDKAVRAYQEANSIKVSGNCGIATFRKILKDVAKQTYKGE